MKYSLVGLVAVVLTVAVTAEVALAQRRSNAVMPQGDQRRSMGNLRPDALQTSPNPSPSRQPRRGTGVLTHRPWRYGNPPYYRRPPVTPYFVYPYRYGYPYGGYWVHPYRIGPRPYYIHPYNYRYVPYPYFPF